MKFFRQKLINSYLKLISFHQKNTSFIFATFLKKSFGRLPPETGWLLLSLLVPRSGHPDRGCQVRWGWRLDLRFWTPPGPIRVQGPGVKRGQEADQKDGLGGGHSSQTPQAEKQQELSFLSSLDTCPLDTERTRRCSKAKIQSPAPPDPAPRWGWRLDLRIWTPPGPIRVQGPGVKRGQEADQKDGLGGGHSSQTPQAENQQELRIDGPALHLLRSQPCSFNQQPCLGTPTP